VPLGAQVREDVLNRPEIHRVTNLYAELLADLTHDGLAAAFAELDGAARRPPSDHVLHCVGHVEHEHVIATSDERNGNRSGELAAHTFGRLVW
jgi:hypothetical protein